MNTLDFVDQASLRDDIRPSAPGDTVDVHVKVIEGTKERIQVFKGVVLRRQGVEISADLHRSQGELRRRRRAHLPGAFAEHRPHCGADPWRCASGQAVLPARTARQEGEDQGKALIPPSFLGASRTVLRGYPLGPAGYADPVTEITEGLISLAEAQRESVEAKEAVVAGGADGNPPNPARRTIPALREGAILVSIAVVLYYVMLTFVARPYLIPSELMEPTLHGCNGCVGDRIMVDKVTYRFSPTPALAMSSASRVRRRGMSATSRSAPTIRQSWWFRTRFRSSGSFRLMKTTCESGSLRWAARRWNAVPTPD